MLQVLSITAPIYLIIGAGYLAVQRGMFTSADMRTLGRLVLWILIPPLFFRAVATLPVAAIFDLRYFAAYAAGSLAVMLGGIAWALRVRGHPRPLAAVHGLGLAAANTAFIGIAIVPVVLGSGASIAVALTLLVENLVVIPLALALMEKPAEGHPAQAAARAFAGLARNPLVLSMALGALVSLAGWTLPAALDRTLALAAGAATPVALFAIGGSLVGLQLAGMRGEVALLALGKLVLHPLAVAAAMWAFGPRDGTLARAGILLAAMPMMSLYPVLAQRAGAEARSAAALLAATVLSFFTLSALLWWLTA